MVLKRYIVEVDSEQALKLSPEQVELAQRPPGELHFGCEKPFSFAL